MNPQQRAQERREEIAGYIMARPHVKLTIPDVAAAFGRPPGRMFGTDLAVVRDWARQAGGLVTNCAWDDEAGQQVFYFLPEGDERRLSGKPLRTVSRAARTRLINAAAQAEYTARNAVLAEDRAYARIQIQIGIMVAAAAEAVREMEDALADR